MRKLIVIFILLPIFCWQITSFAKQSIVKVEVYLTTDPSTKIGEITFNDSQYGLMIYPNLGQLPPGPHGIHLHQHPNCADHGMDTGAHYDPQQTGKHLGPYNPGHLGDLPVLFVADDGSTNTPLLAPRLKLTNLTGLAIIIHEHGDNYSDNPPLGGGGARIACGIIKVT